MVLLTLYLAVATFPGEFSVVRPGLDPSWVYAINRLPHTQYHFGSDLIFTYGPLGYLITPMNIELNLVAAAVLWTLSQLLLVGLILYHYRRDRSVLAVVAFLASFLLALSFGLLYEYRLLVVVGLLLSVPPEDTRLWRLTATTAVVLASVLTFTKMSTGIAALAMLVAAAAGWLQRDRARVREVLVIVAIYAVMTAVLGAVLLGGLAGLFDWLSVMLELSSGYVRAMSVQGPTILMVTGLAAIGVFVLFLAATWLWNRVSLPLAIMFAAGVFFAFRHAFVRHQGRFVYGFLLASFGVFMLTARGRRAFLTGAVAAALVVPPAALAAAEPFCSCPWTSSTLVPSWGWDHLASVLDLDRVRRRLDRESRDALAPARLPTAWSDAIGSSSVDSVPIELSFIPANGLRWIPNPVLQGYHGFTPELDGWTAAHFAGPEAPEYLLLQYADIDQRNPMLAEPELWRAIVARYEVAFEDPASAPFGDVALLRRRSTPLPVEPRTIGRASGRLGEWLPIPSSPGLVLASVDLRHDLDGTLALLLWRIAPVYLDLRYADGATRTVRILPATATEGMVVGGVPFTLDAFLRLLDGRLPEAATAMRLHGPGGGSFEREFDVLWEELPWGSAP